MDSVEIPLRVTLVGLALWLLVFAGIRSAQRGAEACYGTAPGPGVGGIGPVGGSGVVVCHAGPKRSGVPAPGLVLMLWVAFFGASIANHQHRHLRMELLEQRLSGRPAHLVSALANGIAAAATGTLAVCGYCAFLYTEFIETDGLAARFEELGTYPNGWPAFCRFPRRDGPAVADTPFRARGKAPSRRPLPHERPASDRRSVRVLACRCSWCWGRPLPVLRRVAHGYDNWTPSKCSS